MNKQEFITKRTKIISAMLDNPDKNGIYPTTECFNALDALFDSLLARSEAIKEASFNDGYNEGFADGKISESKNPELLKALNRLDSEANIKAIKDHTKEVTKSKKSATKFLTDGEYLDELKEPNQPEEDINTTKGAEKYLKRHDIDIDSYVEKGLKKITRVLKSNPNTSEEVKNKVRQILKKEKEEQPRVSKTEIRNGMSYRLDTKTGMYEPDVNGLNKISIITEGEQSEEKECEHDEGMKQGDGFVYSVCKKCGKDLE